MSSERGTRRRADRRLSTGTRGRGERRRRDNGKRDFSDGGLGHPEMLKMKRREGVEGPLAMCSRSMIAPDESLTTRMKCQARSAESLCATLPGRAIELPRVGVQRHPLGRTTAVHNEHSANRVVGDGGEIPGWWTVHADGPPRVLLE